MQQENLEMSVRPNFLRDAETKISKATGLIDTIASAIEKVDTVNRVECGELNAKADARRLRQAPSDRSGKILIEC